MTSTDTLARPAAPRISAALLEVVTYSPTAVIVQTDSGAVFPLDRLTGAQTDDPTLTVLVDHAQALHYIACAGGRLAAAARVLTTELRAQHARGLL